MAKGGECWDHCVVTVPGLTDSTVRRGKANHVRGREAVGGRMTLTMEALLFRPHAVNIQTEPMAWRVVDISGVDVSSRLFTRMDVVFVDGSVERFAVWRRKSWAVDIERCRART